MISNDLISFEHITHISQKTTEQINEKNLKDFLVTSLELQNITKELYTSIYHVYFSNTNRYEIYAYKIKKDKSILEFQVFETFYKQNEIQSTNCDIFITEKYFCIYQNGKFLFAKENKAYLEDEIKNYVEFTYHIKAQNIYFIDQKELEKLILNSNNLKELKTYSIKKQNRFFKIYILVLMLSCILTFYTIDSFIKENKIKNKQLFSKLQKKHKKSKRKFNTNIALDIKVLFEELKKHKILLLDLKYDKKLFLQISLKKKNSLFKFIDTNDKKIIINSLEQKIDDKTYLVSLTIEN